MLRMFGGADALAVVYMGGLAAVNDIRRSSRGCWDGCGCCHGTVIGTCVC